MRDAGCLAGDNRLNSADVLGRALSICRRSTFGIAMGIEAAMVYHGWGINQIFIRAV